MWLQEGLRCVVVMFPAQNVLKIPFPAHKTGQLRSEYTIVSFFLIFLCGHHSGCKWDGFCPDAQDRGSIWRVFHMAAMGCQRDVSYPGVGSGVSLRSPPWHKYHQPLVFLRLVKISVVSSQSVPLWKDLIFVFQWALAWAIVSFYLKLSMLYNQLYQKCEWMVALSS